MKKVFKVFVVTMLAAMLLYGCNDEKDVSNEKLQEGMPVTGELTKVVTYIDTDLIVNGKTISVAKQRPDIVEILSVEKLSETVVGVTAKINDDRNYFCFFDIESGVYMNEVTGTYFHFEEGEMDSLIYYEEGNICNAYEYELINVEQFGDSVTNIVYDETKTIATVTIHNSQTGKDYELAVQNKWQ